jgi:NAD(P)-dependent dehydrogenase (short-subunit alcohol dehydrogenase family)
MSSQGALLGVAGYGVYGAAKAGVIALSRAAAGEYSADRIRINTVSPGAVKTDLWAGAPPEMLDQVAAGIPLRRVGAPEDIAAAVVYLCSEGAAFITGHNLVVDGGFTAVQK